MDINRILAGAVVLLSLAACGESGKLPTATATSALPAAVKVANERPANMPTMLDTSAGGCALDGVNDQPAQDAIKVADKARLKLAGWAGNVATGTIPPETFIELEGAGRAYVKVSQGLQRLDVASHFNKPGLANAGWGALVDMSQLPAGQYKLHIVQIEGQSGLICDTHRVLILD